VTESINDTVGCDYVELPKAADGMPIYVGDMVESLLYSKTGVVESIVRKIEGWYVDVSFSDGIQMRHLPQVLCHKHCLTIDEILDELEGLRGTGDATYDDVVARAAELAGMLRIRLSL
jgi:hypothetical protein